MREIDVGYNTAEKNYTSWSLWWLAKVGQEYVWADSLIRCFAVLPRAGLKIIVTELQGAVRRDAAAERLSMP